MPAVASGKDGTPPSWLMYPMVIGVSFLSALPAVPPVYDSPKSLPSLPAPAAVVARLTSRTASALTSARNRTGRRIVCMVPPWLILS
jgi:hypothetical protein